MSSALKIRLLMKSVFWGALLSRLDLVEDDTITTAMLTNGKEIRYSPAKLKTLQKSDELGLLIHELLHIVLGHMFRRGGRDPEIWNQACDYAVNDVIKSNPIPGCTLPAGVLYDESFHDLSAEEIYNRLISSQDNGVGNSDNSGAEGENPQQYNDPGAFTEEFMTSEEVRELSENIKGMVVAAAVQAKQMGQFPDGIERFVAKIAAAKVDWRDQLQHLINLKSKGDYTWSKPNRRYISSGMYLPALESQTLGEFVVVIDTSGSIDDKLLGEFAGEIESLLSLYDSASCQVMYVDAKLRRDKIETFGSGDVVEFHPVGGGGTDFRPAFDYLDEAEEYPVVLIYFTDGYCDSYPEEPGYPVIWVVYDNEKFNPPLGVVVHVER